MSPLTPGRRAPDFDLPTADGGRLTLADLAGRRTLVFFYPAAMTPGCSREARDFEQALPDLRAAGYDVVGVSPDPVARLAEFAERDGLSYRLASDESLEMMTAYGAYGEKNLYGRTVQAVIRSSVVIDEEGLVARVFPNVKATGHVARLRRDLPVLAGPEPV